MGSSSIVHFLSLVPYHVTKHALFQFQTWKNIIDPYDLENEVEGQTNDMKQKAMLPSLLDVNINT